MLLNQVSFRLSICLTTTDAYITPTSTILSHSQSTASHRSVPMSSAKKIRLVTRDLVVGWRHRFYAV